MPEFSARDTVASVADGANSFTSLTFTVMVAVSVLVPSETSTVRANEAVVSLSRLVLFKTVISPVSASMVKTPALFPPVMA